MARKIKAPEAVAPAPAPVVPAAKLSAEARLLKVEGDVAELSGDLVRIVDLLVKGDLEAAKFKEILVKRQGKAEVK